MRNLTSPLFLLSFFLSLVSPSLLLTSYFLLIPCSLFLLSFFLSLFFPFVSFLPRQRSCPLCLSHPQSLHPAAKAQRHEALFFVPLCLSGKYFHNSCPLCLISHLFQANQRFALQDLSESAVLPRPLTTYYLLLTFPSYLLPKRLSGNLP